MVNILLRRKLPIITLLLAVFFSAAMLPPDESGPGLTVAEPIGAFLNGNLPAEAPADYSTMVPQLLSETGAFTDLNTLKASKGLLPYDLVESFWTDGAKKQRWMAIPNDGSYDTNEEKVQFSAEEEWVFPVGSVLIKHFEMPLDEGNPTIRKRLETRFSVRATNGEYYFLTYKWREDESDAELLTEAWQENIEVRSSEGLKNKTWYYPDAFDCKACHNNGNEGTIGPKTRYLNSDFTYPQTGITSNQLVTLSHLGVLNETIKEADVSSFLTIAAKDDPEATLEHKARSYLDLNCSYCHQPKNNNRFTFDARLKTPLRFSGLFSDQVVVSIGLQEEWVIHPGDLNKSVLFQRMNTTNPAFTMPPLSRNTVDEEAVTLVAEWIAGLGDDSKNCAFENLAKLGRAFQSSTSQGEYSFGPENAIDGNIIGDDAANTITQTKEERTPWWEIDLSAVGDIKGVRIWNRSDCCVERLSNFHVLVSEEPFLSKDLEMTITQPGVTSIYFPNVASRQTYLDINRTGRYLRIQLAGKGVLNLAEVEVEGCFLESLTSTTIIGEVGETELNHLWQTVYLRRPYKDPVVVAGGASYQDRGQSTVRVRNVTEQSFQVRIDEWDCLDKAHLKETVPYLVVDAGIYSLSNGKTLMAGKVDEVNHDWKKVAFPQSFAIEPIVLAQCTGENEVEPVNARIDETQTNLDQFRVKLVEQDNSEGGHAPEPVHWIAVEPGAWKGETMTFEAANTGPEVENYWYWIEFSEYYGKTPIFIGEVGSERGGDAFALRYDQLSGHAVKVFVEEETCGDDEVKHIPEEVHYLVFDQAGDIVLEDTQAFSPPRSGRPLTVKQYDKKLNRVFWDQVDDGLIRLEEEQADSIEVFFRGEEKGHSGIDLAETPTLMVYPNPVSYGQKLVLDLSWPVIEPLNITLLDLLGRPVRRTQLDLEGRTAEFQFDLMSLPSGVYFLSVAGSEHHISTRVIID